MTIETRAKRPWALWAGVWPLMLAAACSQASQTEPAVSGVLLATPVSSTAPAAREAPMPPQDTEADAQAHIAPLRTVDAAGPVGEPDMWIGAGPLPTGLQRSLGAGDLPGPLLALPYGGVGLFRVFDMCGRSEASFREGGDFSSVVYRYGYDTARRFHKGCHLARFMAVARSRWVQNERAYFEGRSEAQAWTAARRDEHYRTRESAEQGGLGQPLNTAVYGFYDSEERNFGGYISGGPLGMMFAPRDAPVDEVQVLAETVAVSGGVLRGLVRNWSRRLWAYGVTVSAGEHEYVWPLSVQPGELAPFEIAGWDGPDSPEQIQISVTADMSWHTDPSRAWGRDPAPPPQVVVEEATRQPMPDSVRDRYGHVTADVPAGSVSIGSVELDATLGPPESHPSLRGIYRDISIGDLRGYGAVLDGHGRVVDVSPVLTVELTEWDEATNEFLGYEEIQSLPHPQADRPHSPRVSAILHVLFDIHAIHDGLAVDGYDIGEPGGAFHTVVVYRDERVEYAGRSFPRYGTLHGAFVIWVGAAYPARNAE